MLLDQRIDVGAGEPCAVGQLDQLDRIGSARGEIVLQPDRLDATGDAQGQIASVARSRSGRRARCRRRATGGRRAALRVLVGHRVGAGAAAEEIGVRPLPARQRVVASPAVDHVGEVGAEQDVVAAACRRV